MQWNNSNLEVRFPALKEKTHALPSFLGGGIPANFPGSSVWEGGRAGAGGCWCSLHECCTWLRSGLEPGAKSGFKTGGFASTGVFGRAVPRQGCRQCVNRHLSGSAMCAQFLEQKLGCHGCYSALTVQMRAAQGQGVAAGTASCLCQKNSAEAACSKGKACSYLSAKTLYMYPQSGLLERERGLLGSAKLGQNSSRLVIWQDLVLIEFFFK